MQLPAEPASVPAARRFVRGALNDWGLDAVLDDAVLVMSELITNAVLHAQGQLTVRLRTASGGSVRLEVQDGSTRLPRLRGYGNDATTGRGLRMVADLSAEWGVEPMSVGKRVWARIRPAQGAA